MSDFLGSLYDELFIAHDFSLITEQLEEAEKQSRKKTKEREQTLLQLNQTEQEKIMGELQDLRDEEKALRKINEELLEKLDIAIRSQTTVRDKQKDITKLLQKRQEMIEEGTWEKVGGEDERPHVISLVGNSYIGFGFSRIRLQASPTNDIYDWMSQFHPDLLPTINPFPVIHTQKSMQEKKEVTSVEPQTEFPDVLADLKTFIAIRRPGYSLLSLVDRSDDNKRAWLAILTRTLHGDTVERVFDVIIELEPQRYMIIQNVQDS